jgi:hypothetical protein
MIYEMKRKGVEGRKGGEYVASGRGGSGGMMMRVDRHGDAMNADLLEFRQRRED